MAYKSGTAVVVWIVFLIVGLCSIGRSEFAWTKLTLSGGKILDLERITTNPAVFLAIVEENGIYRSDDNGASWTQILSGTFNDIASAPNGAVFIVGKEGLFKSNDTGKSWRQLLSHDTRQVVCHDSLVIADTVSIGYYKNYIAEWIISFDYGERWQIWEGTQTPNLGFPYMFVKEIERGSFMFHENGYIFRSDLGSLFKSHRDNLNTWEQIDYSLK